MACLPLDSRDSPLLRYEGAQAPNQASTRSQHRLWQAGDRIDMIDRSGNESSILSVLSILSRESR